MSSPSSSQGPSGSSISLPLNLPSEGETIELTTVSLDEPEPVPEQERRPQAGPLPSKQGEIGYNPELHNGASGSGNSAGEGASLPARHPADRDAPPPITSNGTTPSTTGTPTSPSPTADSSSTHTASKRSFIRKRLAHLFGISLATLLLLLFQLGVLGSTIGVWVILAMRVGRKQVGIDADGNPSMISTGSASVFIHVVFGVAMLGQLLMVERRLFRLRAERWTYLHPGEILPSHRRDANTSAPPMSLAPWNRPPLPTYAATLAASGLGTGDVEDNVIAAPAPPAYGNTRGSTLLLAGFLPASLRRPPSTHSQSSQMDRPRSYASQDDQWEEICDAERARALEQTLATLEERQGHGHAVTEPERAVLRN